METIENIANWILGQRTPDDKASIAIVVSIVACGFTALTFFVNFFKFLNDVFWQPFVKSRKAGLPFLSFQLAVECTASIKNQLSKTTYKYRHPVFYCKVVNRDIEPIKIESITLISSDKTVEKKVSEIDEGNNVTVSIPFPVEMEHGTPKTFRILSSDLNSELYEKRDKSIKFFFKIKLTTGKVYETNKLKNAEIIAAVEKIGKSSLDITQILSSTSIEDFPEKDL